MLNTIIDNLHKEQFIRDILSDGGEIFLVGGCVRDSLLGKEPKDIDLLVRLIQFEKLVELLNSRGKVTLTEVGDKFGIIKFVPIDSFEDFDIALPRIEVLSEVGEGRNAFDVNSNPNITIKDDLTRRDFTINAIAVEISTGKIIDPFNGKDDLEKELIRMVNVEAFNEDPLRMLRAVQFASRFPGFQIEPNTLFEIRKNAKNIKTITGERIKDELDKIFHKGNIKKGIFNFHITGLRNRIFDVDFSSEFIAKDIKTFEDFWFAVCGSELFKTVVKGDIKTFNTVESIELLLSEDFETVPDARLFIVNRMKKGTDFLNSKLLKNLSGLEVQIAMNQIKDKKFPISNKEVDITSEELMKMGWKGIDLGLIWKEIFESIHRNEIENTNKDIVDFLQVF